MNIKSISKVLALSLVLLLPVACDKKDKDIDEPENPILPDNPDKPDTPTGSDEVMSPSAAFSYIKDTALDALSAFNPEDQREILATSKAFIERYGDYEMPSEFDDLLDEDDYYYKASPTKVVRALVDAIAKRNPGGLTRASYDYSIRDLAGIYEPNSRYEEWVKVADSESVIFRAPVDGDTYQIMATPADGQWIYDDYIAVPKTLTTTLTYGSKVLAKVVVKSEMDLDRGNIYLQINAEAANVTATALLRGTNSKVTEEATLIVNGNTILTTQTEINGTGLCDFDNYDGKEIYDLVKNASGSASSLNRVFVNSSVSNIRTLYDAFDCWYDSYDGISLTQAEREVLDACDRINRNLIAEVKFAGSSAVQANLTYVPRLYTYSYGNGWDIYPSAAIKYAYDGTVEILETSHYNFDNVVKQYENLIRRYENFIKSL